VSFSMDEGARAVLITGGSGTVGTALVPAVARRFSRTLAIGRQRPVGLRTTDSFIRADFSQPSEVDATCAHIMAPIAGVVLAAGVDSRASLAEVTVAEFETCMRVNCLSAIQLLAAAVRNSDAHPLPVVMFSSDVIGGGLPHTVTYASSKAALEETLRHAVADVPDLAVLLVRLPDLGVAMTRTNGSRPEPASPSPSAALESAIDRAIGFLAEPPEPGTVEVWTDA